MLALSTPECPLGKFELARRVEVKSHERGDFGIQVRYPRLDSKYLCLQDDLDWESRRVEWRKAC